MFHMKSGKPMWLTTRPSKKWDVGSEPDLHFNRQTTPPNDVTFSRKKTTKAAMERSLKTNGGRQGIFSDPISLFWEAYFHGGQTRL